MNKDGIQQNFEVQEIQLSYKNAVPYKNRIQVRDSQSAYQVLLSNWSDDIAFVEEFNILLLDNASKVLGITRISKGGISSTVVDGRLVFSAALLARASSIILSHNHPSFNMKPSKQDIQLTKKLASAGKLIDIQVFDHLIISPHNYFSFADEGLL